MSLHNYQERAVEEIRKHFAEGKKRVLLHLATGGGKTHVFCHILKAAAERGTTSVMVVRGRQLVDQASQRLFKEGVRHGVRMSNHWNKDYGALTQVCSIDTLTSRESYPPGQLVVIDEAHLATSQGYQKFLEHFKDAYILSVTATPYTTKPLDFLADAIVHPITVKELVAQGFLVAPRYFAPSTPDLKGVRRQNGDYVASQLEERMNTLTGDIISHWQKYGENRPTLMFACNVQHSLSLVKAFVDAGIPAQHVEAQHTFDQRKEAIEKLRTGEIKVLSNVGILCTGVDIPFVSCLVLARPTQSYNLFIQQCGRGTRQHPGKENFILLDHAGNVLRHGFIDDEPEINLEGGKRTDFGVKPKLCRECYSIYLGAKCPECGAESHERKERETEIVVGDGVLKEIKHLPFAAEVTQFVMQLKRTRRLRGYKRGWVYHQVKEKYGDEIASQVCPKPKLPTWFVRDTQQTSERSSASSESDETSEGLA